MHVLTLVETDPRNFKPFEEWINSRDYGSRPFCREIRLYDLNINEKSLERFLGDLKYYDYQTPIKHKMKIVNWIIKMVHKIFGLKYIDMSKIEKTPLKWFEHVKFGGVPFLYLKPLGTLPDVVSHGNEEI